MKPIHLPHDDPTADDLETQVMILAEQWRGADTTQRPALAEQYRTVLTAL